MLLSSIDVGSNSVRLLVGDVASGSISPVCYGRVVTRLASGIEKTGLLDGSAMRRTVAALKGFSEKIKESGAHAVKSIGTSALREAGNSKEFLDCVKRETGLDIEVVPADKEALITAKGIISSISHRGTSVMIDIGGGSTEWMVCRGDDVVLTGSMPVGVVKLLEKYIISDPPSGDDIRHLDDALEGASRAIWQEVAGYLDAKYIEEGTVLIGTAGTASTHAAIDLGLERFDPEKVHSHLLALERLRGLSSMLCSLAHDKRAAVRGLGPDRADLIIPGIRFTIKLMEALGFDAMSVSAYGLLEGALLELYREVSR